MHGHASPLPQIHLSYSESGSGCGDKRDAALHATPGRGCVSPKEKLQQQASDAPDIRRICTDGFHPVTRNDSPSTVNSPGRITVFNVTPKQTSLSKDQRNNSSVRTRKRSSAANDQGKEKNKEKPTSKPKSLVTKTDTEITKHNKLFEARDKLDDVTIVALGKEDAAHDMALLDTDASRMTRDNLDQPTKNDNKVKVDAKLSNKLGYNRFVIEDVWKIGSERLMKDDINIGTKRAFASTRLERRSNMTMAINASEALDVSADFEFKAELEVTNPSWAMHTTGLFSGLY